MVKIINDLFINKPDLYSRAIVSSFFPNIIYKVSPLLSTSSKRRLFISINCRYEGTTQKLPVRQHTDRIFSDMYLIPHFVVQAKNESFLGIFITAYVFVIFCMNGCYLQLYSTFWVCQQYYCIETLSVRKYLTYLNLDNFAAIDLPS